MPFQHDRTAEVTFYGEHYTIKTTVDVPATGDLDKYMEPGIVAKAAAFFLEFYGWDLTDTWFNYSIEPSHCYVTD